VKLVQLMATVGRKQTDQALRATQRGQLAVTMAMSVCWWRRKSPDFRKSKAMLLLQSIQRLKSAKLSMSKQLKEPKSLESKEMSR
jgi:hypothetical protein